MKIKRIYIKPHSPKWFEFRKNGIGGSETASVLSTESKILADLVHTPAIKLFALKIGEPVQEFTGNQASEAGNYQEPNIINLFRHYDLENPDPYLAYKRANSGAKPLNKVIQPKSYFTNSKYPHLFSSPDGLLYKNGKAIAGVEAKLTNSFEAGRYPNRVSPAFVMQAYQNMMVTGINTWYLCILVDGLFFEVITLHRDDKIFEQIELISARFWSKVLQARIIKEESGLEAYYNINPAFLTDSQQESVQAIQQLEPVLSGTESELEFVKEMCKPTPEYSEMIGTPEQFRLCVDYLSASREEKQAKSKKQLATSELIVALGGFHAAKFDLDGKELKYSYKPDKNGNLSIYVSPKFLQEEQ